ncbi:MAG: hypothetical protein LBO70_00505 [Clostridiales Family XIII bacterium]|nr:hypothetical protein [Clostridiales Family XIII bacterium]
MVTVTLSEKRRHRIVSLLLSILLIAGVLGIAGAAPQSAAHAAAGDILTINVPAGVTGDINAYVYDTAISGWRSIQWAEIGEEAANQVSFSTLTYRDDDGNLISAQGKKVTFTYTPDSSALRNIYGNIQTYGGYFGYPGDKGASLTSLVLTSPTTVNFTPLKGAKVTLKVTPVDNMNVAGGGTVNTSVMVYKYAKSPTGKMNLTLLDSDNSYRQSAYANGVYTFIVQPAASYAFQATGEVKQGQVWVDYTPSWLGGHQGSSANTPDKIKIFKAPATGKSKGAGTIALTLGSATITGTTVAERNISISNPFTGISYNFYADATSYSQKVEPGFYVVSNGITNKFISVKKGKKATVNFTTNPNPNIDQWSANVSIKVSGTVKKGKKLTASVKLYNLPYQFKAPKFKYIWTDGVNILGKKSTYKVKSADVKKGEKLFVISYGTKYGYTHWAYHTVR